MFRAYRLRKHNKLRVNISTSSVLKRNLGFIEKYDDIVPGDILLFRPAKKSTIDKYMLMLIQSLLDEPHGHFDTMHAAICVGKTLQNKAIMAHVNIYGWHKISLADMIEYEGGERAFIVFRPGNAIVAHAIANTAADQQNKNIKWKMSAAVSSIFYEARPLNFDNEISESSFCSKFVVQVIKTAVHQLGADYQKFMPFLNSSATPKALEAYLFKDRCYEMLVHCGSANPYDLIMQYVTTQITRLDNKEDKASADKAIALKHKQSEIAAKLATMDHLNPIDKTLLLLKNIKDELMIETSYNPRSTTTSYRMIVQQAREVGIFQRDVEAIESSVNLNAP